LDRAESLTSFPGESDAIADRGESTLPFVTAGAAPFGPQGGYMGLIPGSALFGAGAVIVAYCVTARLAKRHKVL
jgi:hypothetical protein